MPNLLIHESSPYLLQHANNPVHWHAWNEATLHKARTENKMLLISIGYSACHWCHVMEHESFEDAEVAAVMNEHFLCVKVDREERPDIDQVYMNCAMIVSGHGGWPLNAFALPDGKPYYAGTYFPKARWIQVLHYFANLFKNEPQKLSDQADQILEGLRHIDHVPLYPNERDLTDKHLLTVWENWKDRLDYEWGGKSGAPKFMMPNNDLFLLRYFHYTGDDDCGAYLKQSLKKMAFGALYDAIGGGFSRYSVDPYWKVPHFEKMLYDNAQLLSLYSEAYRQKNRPLYKGIIEQTFEWLEREMTDKSGGLYSAQDADSEGVEGKYYVWTREEFIAALENHKQIASLIARDDVLIDLALELYNITDAGNWEHGNNVLFRTEEHEYFCEKYRMKNEDFHAIVKQINQVLFHAQEKRIKPATDDKILTEWNALAITGLCDAYQALGDEKYRIKALTVTNFILHNLLDGAQLFRNYKNGKRSIPALLADYACLIEALTKVYSVTLDESFLQKAVILLQHTLQHFYDDKTGMFYLKSDQDEALIVRSMDSSDNVIPAANSIMANNLFTLGKITDNREWEQMAMTMLNNVLDEVLKNGPYYSNWAILLYRILHQDREIIVVGENAESIIHTISKHYLPNALLLGCLEKSPLLHFRDRYVPGKTLIYVCRNKACDFPVESPDEIWKTINR